MVLKANGVQTDTCHKAIKDFVSTMLGSKVPEFERTGMVESSCQTEQVAVLTDSVFCELQTNLSE